MWGLAGRASPLGRLHEIFDYDFEDPAIRLEPMLLLPVWLRGAAEAEAEAAGGEHAGVTRPWRAPA